MSKQNNKTSEGINSNDSKNNNIEQYSETIINKIENDEESYDQIVEKERNVILSAQKKAKKLSTISTIMVLLFGVAAFTLYDSFPTLAYVCIGLALVVLIACYILTKRIYSPDIKGYIYRSYSAINKYVFNDANYSDVVFNPNYKLDLSNVSEDGIYENISDVVSRNYVTCKYKGLEIVSCDAALFKTKTKTSAQTYFVGKYYTSPNSLSFDGYYVLINANALQDKRVDKPNFIESLKCLSESDGFYIYGPKDNDKVVSKDIINKFKEINLDQYLLNNILVIWSGRSVVYSSYDDKVVALPFYDPINTDAYSKYKDDFARTAELLSVLGK